MRIPPKYIPNQTELSVQDAPTTLTLPEFINFENEEMRRLRFKGKPAEAVIDKTPAPTPSVPTAPIAEPFDETVLHNNIIVVGDQVKRINFIDTDNAKFNVTKQLAGITGKQQANVKVLVKTPDMMKGVVYVNTLPFTPTEMGIRYPDGIPDAKWYEGEYYNMVPPLYYGWSVYQIIEHNWGLTDPNNYIIDLKFTQEFTDLSEYNDTDLDIHGNIKFDADANFQDRFHDGYIDVLHYGLNPNTIILRGMYCPDLDLIPSFNQDNYVVYQHLGIRTKDNYTLPEGHIDEYLLYLDETEHIMATNLVYNFTLLKGS